MDVYIETYRGFKIFFNKDRQAFYVEAELLSDQDRRSFAACRAAIDDFLKDLTNFIRFKVQDLSGKIIEITGMSKDGRFFYEEDGKKKSIGKYDLHRYVLYAEELQEFFHQKQQAEEKVDELMKEVSRLRDIIIESGTLLSEYNGTGTL